MLQAKIVQQAIQGDEEDNLDTTNRQPYEDSSDELEEPSLDKNGDSRDKSCARSSI